jgi:hypothetical protein
VRNFEAEHFTSLPVGTLFTDEARSALISKADGRLTLAKFFQYPLEILLKELQKAVRPLSKESFRQAIRDNISFPLDPERTPDRSNGEVFYDAITLFCERFSFLFSFLAKDTHATVKLQGRWRLAVIRLDHPLRLREEDRCSTN